MGIHDMMHRRDLLCTAISATAASVLGAEGVEGAAAVNGAEAGVAGKGVALNGFVDTNVSLFQWPFRRLPLDDVDALVKKLRLLGVTEAWAGSFEGILHRDVVGVNDRLAEVCGGYAELVPIGSVNLELPDWEHGLQRCLEVHQMPGVRLHPNYHGYTLADKRFERLLKRVTRAGCFVQIATAMEDTRTQHPLVRALEVDLSPLPKLMRATAGARVQLLNGRLKGSELEALGQTPGVYFDTARSEGTDGVGKLMESVPPERVMFGTHAPFLIPEAALIRVYESGLEDNAQRLLMRDNALGVRGGRS